MKCIKKREANLNQETGVNRNYKDRLFRLVFQEKRDLLDLYNAIEGLLLFYLENQELLAERGFLEGSSGLGHGGMFSRSEIIG